MANTEANKLLEERTLTFAVAVVRFVGGFSRADVTSVMGEPLLKAGTSIGLSYRDANRSESREEFAHKSALVLKACAETDYWLEICTQTDLGDMAERDWLVQEARELLAIFTTIHRRARGH